MDVTAAFSQIDTKEGQIQLLAYEDLTGLEGRLVKIVDDSNVPSFALPAAQNDLAIFILTDGGDDGELVSALPLVAENNMRVRLNGTCNAGERLVLDISSTNYGKVKTIPATAGLYLVIGVAEEDGVDEQLVKFRPMLSYVHIESANFAALTDNSGGVDPEDDTIAAVTNLDTLTDSTGGTADDTIADCSTAVTGVDGSGSNAASKADVDTRLGVINVNFKNITDQVITQKAANTAMLAAIAQLAAKINEVVAALKEQDIVVADS